MVLLALLLGVPLAVAQTPPPATTPPAVAPDTARRAPPATPPSPVSGIRNKISAGDLRSAESILDWHREQHGEDLAWLNGLGWLARGALLLDEPAEALRLARIVRAQCADRIAKGADLTKTSEIETALGAAIEVEAQIIARRQGAKRAAAFVQSELTKLPAPVSLRSRLHKRINLMTLTGQPAPELAIEDFLGERPPSLASLRGKPVVLFLWAEWCGDCKAQASTLARLRKRHDGVQILAVTRYYDDEPKRTAEKARVDSVWKAVYGEVGAIPIVFGTATMERYGGSSTPTYVFIDRQGVVRSYLPFRLTDAAFDRELAALENRGRRATATKR